MEQTTVAETTSSAAMPQDNNARWEAANSAYNEGHYGQAAELYEAILAQQSHSAKVYFNLANAYFKQYMLGKAILNYNRALRLAPTDEDIQHNLEYAEQATKDRIEEIPEFFLTSWVKAVRNMLSCDGWAALSIVMLILALSAALFYLLAERLSLRKAGFYVMCIAGIMFILTTLFASQEHSQIVERNEAIVMSSSVSIKSSPDSAATELFLLHEGTKLFLGQSIDQWVEVRIADGRKGWIESSRIERI